MSGAVALLYFGAVPCALLTDVISGIDDAAADVAASGALPMLAPFDTADPRSALPTPLARLIGREREIDELRALLLDEGVRLLTLTGPGGVGKTRVAIELATSVSSVSAFRDGTRFVPLAPVADPGLVAHSIARAIGTGDVGDGNLIGQLKSALYGRHLLLVIDNFEQVVDAAPLLADLLTFCPHLVALVTSRVRLRVSGEREYAIAPLTLPSDGFVSASSRPSSGYVAPGAMRGA